MNKLKELRKEKGLTQQGLADIVGVTKRTIIAWEKSDRDIKSDKAQALADYFEVSVGYLLGYSEFKGKDDFVQSIEKSDVFGDENFSDDSEKVFFRDYDLIFSTMLLQHYHKEIGILLNHILGAYIQKDTDNILTSDELAQMPILLDFLTNQHDETVERYKFLKEVVTILKAKYKI